MWPGCDWCPLVETGDSLVYKVLMYVDTLYYRIKWQCNLMTLKEFDLSNDCCMTLFCLVKVLITKVFPKRHCDFFQRNMWNLSSIVLILHCSEVMWPGPQDWETSIWISFPVSVWLGSGLACPQLNCVQRAQAVRVSSPSTKACDRQYLLSSYLTAWPPIDVWSCKVLIIVIQHCKGNSHFADCKQRVT